MTPVSVPPVITHAWAAVAAETRPLLNSSCSSASSVSACAPPVTEMMISGGGSFHTLIRKGTIREAGVVSAMVKNCASVPCAGNWRMPWSDERPFLRAKMTRAKWPKIMLWIRTARCTYVAARTSRSRCVASALSCVPSPSSSSSCREVKPSGAAFW